LRPPINSGRFSSANECLSSRYQGPTGPAAVVVHEVAAMLREDVADPVRSLIVVALDKKNEVASVELGDVALGVVGFVTEELLHHAGHPRVACGATRILDPFNPSLAAEHIRVKAGSA